MLPPRVIVIKTSQTFVGPSLDASVEMSTPALSRLATTLCSVVGKDSTSVDNTYNL